MINARFRTIAAAVAVVAALGTLSACGGKGGSHASHSGGSSQGNSPTTALAALKLDESKIDQADSAKVDSTMTVNGLTTSTTGAMDWSNGLIANMTIKMSGQNAAALKQMGSDGTFQARYLPDAMYVDMGQAIAQSTGGKPWLKYEYAELTKVLGASGSALQEGMKNSDPTLSVKMLVASGEVKSVGSETVRGAKATHYTGTLQLSKMVGTAQGLDAATAKQLQSQLTAMGISSEHVDVWVDSQGLLVKAVQSSSTKSGPFSATTYYSDYGVNVSVTPPPASQTADVASLMGQQG